MPDNSFGLQKCKDYCNLSLRIFQNQVGFRQEHFRNIQLS